MIVGKKNLEKRIDSVGHKAIELSYETLTNLELLNASYYTEVLSAGYKALDHRKSRLLKHYEIQKNPWFLDNLYVRNVERYVSKMMTVKAQEFFLKPPPKPNLSVTVKLFHRFYHSFKRTR